MSPKENARPPICKYYLQNNCSRGATCFYSHQQGPTPILPMALSNHVCIHYQRGSCRFGSQCRQLHPAERNNALAFGPATEPDHAPGRHSTSQVPHPRNPSTFGPCKFFEQGNCAKGVACSFAHILSSDSNGHVNPFASPFKSLRYTSDLISAPKASDVSMHDRPVAHRPPCKFFGRGECMKGAGCQFLHIFAEPLTSSPQSRLDCNLQDLNNVSPFHISTAPNYVSFLFMLS